MGNGDRVDERTILGAARIGLWRVEFSETMAPRFYADEVMDDLLGASGPMTPEERFVFHHGCIHQDDLELFERYSQKLCEEPTEIVYRYIHPKLGEMIVRCNGRRDESVTSCISIVGTHQDISATRRLEQDKAAEMRLAEMNTSLRREQVMQENYYRQLLDVQSCGLMAYTLPDHRVIHLNAEGLRMFGLDSVEEVQRQLKSIMYQVHYPEDGILEKLVALRENDGSVDYEAILFHGKPNECHIMAKTKVFRTPVGERMAVTTFLDVSEMIMLKRALRQAEEGNRAKSAFLFAMSHDLRTPMNAIIGYTELMVSHWGEKECTTEYLYKLREASRFLLALIGNVLELSRVESGKETLHEAPADLLGITRTLNVLLENELIKKKLTMTQEVNLLHSNVVCDETKVREILMNLLSNAVKYTPDGGSIHLTITEETHRNPDWAMYRMIVEDTGIGIGRDYIPQLFDAFTRERNSSECGIMGTGLGLRIVKSFVDMMGGNVSVESQRGLGSRFTVILPFRIALEPEKDDVREAPLEEPLVGKRILLVEDNELNAEITTTVLQDSGLQVELARDGIEALDALLGAEEDHFDLVLMDIQMPRMNGYDATRNIRMMEGRRGKVPVVAMTANAFDEDRQAAFAAGMDEYIVKPVEIKRLLQTMALVLGRKGKQGKL